MYNLVYIYVNSNLVGMWCFDNIDPLPRNWKCELDSIGKCQIVTWSFGVDFFFFYNFAFDVFGNLLDLLFASFSITLNTYYTWVLTDSVILRTVVVILRKFNILFLFK